MIIDLPEHLNELRARAAGASIDAVLAEACEADFLLSLDQALRLDLASSETHFGHALCSEIAERLPVANAWPRIFQYCAKHTDDFANGPAHLLEILIAVFGCDSAGAWIGTNVVTRHAPELQFDRDALLVGPSDRLQFTNDGILIGQRLLFYRGVPGVHRTGAFLDDLLLTAGRNREQCNYFGFAIDPSAVVSDELYRATATAQFIRGPRGLLMDKLLDPMFPADPTGTMSVHQRVLGEANATQFPVERLEVMWSRRDGIKTVQIEELVPWEEPGRIPDARIVNRYVHAIWDPGRRRFRHFDGAQRAYRRADYEGRLRTDYKKYPDAATCYEKVFRLDAQLTLEDWGRLTAKYFDGNELAAEYLEEALSGA